MVESAVGVAAALVEVCAGELLAAELWRQRAQSRSMP
jgi:hypothetical protein